MAEASSPRTDEAGQLEGKVALITGSVRRNGRAMALALAGDGAAIVVHAKNSADEAKAVAKEIEDRGGRAMVHLADVADEAAVQGMIDAIIANFGRLDILINNAANRNQVAFAELTLENWNAVMGAGVGGEPADVDDGAAAAGDHVGNGRARAQEGAAEDDAHDLVPVLDRQLGEGDLVAVGGVVDEDVEPAEVGDDGVDHALYGGLLGNVRQMHHGAAAPILDFLGHCFGFIGRVLGVDDDGGAISRQGQRHGAAVPAHRSGDQRDLSLELPRLIGTGG